jgi:formate hydrogenlyase subunit 4
MIVNLITLILLPLLLPGIINKTKAIMVGRKGQSLFQPFFNVIKLLQKGEVISQTAGSITRYAPILALSATVCSALFIPFISRYPIIGFKGDFLLFIYLLALAKGIMALAAMDSGSSFEGMGTSREMSYTAFLEPAFMLVIASLIYGGMLLPMAEMFSYHSIDFKEIWSLIVAIMTAMALFIMLLVEAARVPFDDPNTHLELTMIHEVMVLDYSGFSLALIHYTASLKMLIYASLIAHLLLPPNIYLAPLFYLIALIIIALSIGILESLMARFRMNRNLELVLVPVSISLLVMAAMIARNVGGW